MRLRVLPLVLALALVGACDKKSPAQPTPIPAPTPTVRTWTLSGSVVESAPTLSTKIPGATLTVTDGPNAGTVTTTNAAGEYAFAALTEGTFTLRVEKPGYDTVASPFTLTANATINNILKPTLQIITSSRNESISGGDQECPSALGITGGCKAYILDVHHAGTVTAHLEWTDRDTWLWLGLYRSDGARLVESSQSRVDGLFQNISTNVQAGQRYYITLRYALGSRITSFSSTVTRPN